MRITQALKKLIFKKEQGGETKSPYLQSMTDGLDELNQMVAGDVVVPISEVITVPENKNLVEALRVVLESGHSRIPVLSDDGAITGILYAKDLLNYWGAEASGQVVKNIMRSPQFVPDTKSAVKLLKEFKRGRFHLVIALDEYGETIGIITIEDILEEIVGEIFDEYDEHDEFINTLPSGELEVNANCSSDLLADILSIKNKYQSETGAGLLSEIIGHVPTAGESIKLGKFQVIVIEVEDRSPKQILIKST